MSTPVPGAQSALEKAAIIARSTLLPQNVYNNVADANEYTATHTRALADTKTPIQGKGTGNPLDINNYSAGGDFDINGSSSYNGSGRAKAITQNQATWGYGPTAFYKRPDSSLNVGEVVI